MDVFWLVPGRLAGGSRPGARRFRRASPDPLADDLAALGADGIAAILTLTTRPLPDALARHELVTLHVPIRDFAAPSVEQLATAIAWIDDQLAHGSPTLVHCDGGRGRTGIVLAAWLVAHGRTVEEAVTAVRKIRPRAVETRGQWRALRRFRESVSRPAPTPSNPRCDT
ncbi:MAG: dual specificity protein phosphatase family protein [Chloroflexota bacterium]|nr:dual specificity protein phosphatase family protein [Chloroflexota bacterium]